MLFNYKVQDPNGRALEGSIEAINKDVAISSLQSKGYIIETIVSADQKSIMEMEFTFLERVSMREIVILSRQISTLFEAQVSALRVFRLLGSETSNPKLQRILSEVADDLQGGSSISRALSKHPAVFSDFYVNMVRSGEETGKLDETFQYLADYLDRTYEVTSKARNALIYPAFVIAVFFLVMGLMLVVVIPKIGSIIEDSGQEVPIYTKIVLGTSHFLQSYGWIFLIVLVILGALGYQYSRTEGGKYYFDSLKIQLPVIGNLYRKLYLSRISDNLSTMLSSGIAMIRTIEITAAVVDNAVFEQALLESINDIKNGASISSAFSKHEEIPGIVVQMIKVVEETGELGNILNTLAKFYRREVQNAVDTMIGLIEPMMIVLLGLGVGILLASVLLPIYNITVNI